MRASEAVGPPADPDSGPALSGKADPETAAPGVRERLGCNRGMKEGFLKKLPSESQLGMPSSGSRSRPGKGEGQALWPSGQHEQRLRERGAALPSRPSSGVRHSACGATGSLKTWRVRFEAGNRE